MKHFTLILIVTLLVSGCGGFFGRSGSDRAQAHRQLVGTWEHELADSPGYRQIKILSGSHFVWATYERDAGMMVSVGGGTYEFDGIVYIETLQFGSEGLPADLIGQEQVFKARLDGDRWLHEGTLSNGFQVREVWTRID
jgi:hypothetical protein